MNELTAAAAWLNSTFAGLDEAVAQFAFSVHESPVGRVLDILMPTITPVGKLGVIFLALLLLLFKPTRKLGVASALGLILGALCTNVIIKNVVARPRPYADPNGPFYQWWVTMGQHAESDLSFPSGHSTASFAFTISMLIVWRKGGPARWLLLIAPVLIALSRIYLMVHYTSDVLGGTCIGIIAGILGGVIARALLKSLRRNKPELYRKLFKRKKKKHA